MARFALVAVFATLAFVEVSSMSQLEFGTTMSVRAYDLVCWYEKLKKFPNTESEDYTMKCFGQAGDVAKQMKNDDYIKKYFGDWMVKLAMDGLPNEYGSSCNSYLKDLDKKAAADESDTLNDRQSEPYPFQGFAYCLLGHLREKFGNKAIDAVKSEKTHGRKHWMTTMLDRENEFRALHGAQQMKLVTELNEKAQKWADKMASECEMKHSKNTIPDRKWNGAITGENLATGPIVPKEDAAYIAADGFYEEVKLYPWPEYKGDGSDHTFHEIGHFTQSVWKETKYAGYGYAENPDCGEFQHYIAARYSPAGNVFGDFGLNVVRPQ